MQYFSIDKELDRIYNISRIVEIELSNIALTGSNTLFPLLSVTYYNDKNRLEFISCIPHDKYFEIFVKKVVEVYNKEKDEDVLPQLSPFKKETLKIDDRTKQILLSGKLEEINNAFSLYKDMTPYDHSLLLENNDLDFIIQIAVYHLKKFIEKTNCNLEFTDETNGYKYNHVLYGKKDGSQAYFPFIYTKLSDEKIRFEFGNLFPKTSSTNIDITFKRNKIEVILSNDIYGIVYTSTYTLEDNELIETHNTELNDELVFYETIKHNETKEIDSSTYFLLPWGALYSCEENETVLDEESKTITKVCRYIQTLKNRVLKKEFYSNEYKNKKYNNSYVLSEYIKSIITHPLSLIDNIHVIETYFHDTLHNNEFYTDRFKRKYFYHVSKGKKLQDISPEDLHTLYSKNINSSGELNEDNILKMIGGK